MADIVDIGNDRAQEILDDAIAAARRAASAPSEGTGECMFCSEALSDKRRWCDADCRDMWERLQVQRRGV